MVATLMCLSQLVVERQPLSKDLYGFFGRGEVCLKRDYIKPRALRFRSRAEVPNSQFGILLHRFTRFTKAPSGGLKIITASPKWCVKPFPGSPRSFVGANIVPDINAKPSGY